MSGRDADGATRDATVDMRGPACVATCDAVIAALPALAVAVAATDREVAGWIGDDGIHVLGRFAPDGFALGDAALLALVAAARGPRPPRALFHSHPGGRAALSAADRRAWAPTGVPLHAWPQLVIATRGGRAVAAALFAWRGEAPIRIGAYRRAAGDGGAWGDGAAGDRDTWSAAP